MTKVTVIIPVYNGMPYLVQCLDSVVHQTLDDFDIVIVNDGSTDGTAEVLADYAKKYPFIKVLTQKNQGLFIARRNGLAAADGEYVGWVDADDFVKEDMYKKLYEAAVAGDSELAYCDYAFYPQKIATKEKWFRPYSGKRDVDFIERNSQPWNKLVKRELLDSLHIGDLFPQCFDEAYIKVLIHAKNPVSLNEELYYYRVGKGSMSSAYTNVQHYEKFIEASRCLKENLDEDSAYWQEYFDYRIIYYTLMTMLVAAHAGDKAEYKRLRKELRSHKYSANRYLKYILKKNFGGLKSFAIRDVIPMSYSAARLAGRVAFRS